MKINLSKTLILKDVDVRVDYIKDQNGCVQYIDFISNCPDCDEEVVLQRFISLSDDELQEFIDFEKDCKTELDDIEYFDEFYN